MANNNHEHAEHHFIEFNVYVKILVALLVLTGLTLFFFFVRHDIGWLATPLAFLIATTKAALVLMYFMHLKYDKMLNRVIFGTGFFFLMLLFFFCAVDIFTRVTEHSTL